MILVMDLDETMVYTRRKIQPPHENYQVVKVEQPPYSSTKAICTSSSGPTSKNTSQL
jgi:hypothetical protein